MKKTILLASVTLMTCTHFASAGTISLSAPFTDDLSTGISNSNTYTHAISGGSPATVNGVDFDLLDAGNTPANFSWDTGGLNKNQIAANNGDWVPATGGVTGAGIQNLLSGFTFSGNGDTNPASQTFSLLDLTVGQTYDTRLYIRAWDTDGGTGRLVDINFTHGAESDATGTAPEDRPSLVLGGGNDHQAFFVNYQFTALATQLDISAQVAAAGGPASGSLHMYALTNQVVPEPSTLGLLGLALIGLLRRRR